MVLRQAIRRENVDFGEWFGNLMSVALEVGISDPTPHCIKDLAAAKDYFKASIISNNHPACTSTCAMKPKERGGVANERLIVYGTNNLSECNADDSGRQYSEQSLRCGRAGSRLDHRRCLGLAHGRMELVELRGFLALVASLDGGVNDLRCLE